MSVLNLPDEVLIIIFKKLDTKSLLNVYNTCKKFKSVVSVYGIIKSFRLRTSGIPAVDLPKQSFFHDIAICLEELNLSGVPDINKKSALAIARRLTGLKTFNVAYTEININDLVDIVKTCPTIKNVAVNFLFSNSYKILCIKMLKECQNIFSQFDNVEFVGTDVNLAISKAPLYIVENCDLQSLKFVLTKFPSHPDYIVPDEIKVGLLNFQLYSLFFCNWNIHFSSSTKFIKLSVAPYLNNDLYEYVVINRINFHFQRVYTSKMFKGFFMKYFGVYEENDLVINDDMLSGNAAILIWNKKSTTFDEDFFLKCQSQLEMFFPCQYYDLGGSEKRSHKSNWYHITVNTDAASQSTDRTSEPLFKKQRVGVVGHPLGYEGLGRRNEPLKVTFEFYIINMKPVSLSSEYSYLNRLTYLSLTGPFVSFTLHFFNVLFTCCHVLTTLNVDACPLLPCSEIISKSMLHSKSLRNFRLVDKYINFHMLTKAMTAYGLLENIHLVDKAKEVPKLFNICDLIEKNINLYSLFVKALMTDSMMANYRRIANKVKKKYNRSYVNVELYSNKINLNGYDPFIDVFDLHPIKAI